MSPKHKLQKTIPPWASRLEPQKLYILVMGLTGAGKNTFISVVTGNEEIPIGAAAELDGGMKLIFTLVPPSFIR